MNIYAGNFAYDVTESDLKEAFQSFGYVLTAKIMRNNCTGESRGFGFVEMPHATEAQAALLSTIKIKGKKITIREARPQNNKTIFRIK